MAGSEGALLTLWIFTVITYAKGCPSRCICFRTTVRCMYLRLDHIPPVPEATTILDLRFNKIKDIPPGTFGNLPHLHTLLLNHNGITQLVDRAFKGLPELRFLYLYKNKIRIIEQDAFKGLSKLEQLFLHNNQLKRLPVGIFSHLDNLVRLRLDSNNLVCDCQLMWLIEKLKEMHQMRTISTATCGLPQKLHGRSLMTLSTEDLHCKRPKFIKEPKDVNATFGNTVYFRCQATGDPNPEIIWFHDNIVVNPAENRFRILDDGTLMIEDIRDTDKGDYKCIARNAAGEIATQVQMNYIADSERPYLTHPPSDVTTVQGETIQLTCTASGEPHPQISWTRNGNSLSFNNRFRLLSSGALLIVNIQQADQGLYRCTAMNNAAAVSAEARVTVQVQAKIFLPPKDQTFVEGSVAMFRCIAEGNPVPIITWSKNGEPLPNNGRFEILDNTETLLIRRVELSDRGVYICRAENAAGRREALAELAVTPKIPPSIVQRQPDVEVLLGSDVSLQCQAEGSPTPQYRWIKDRLPVQYNNKFILSGDSLIIRNAALSDAGRYECVAENTVGVDRNTLQLRVRDRIVSYMASRLIEGSANEARNLINKAVNNTVRHLFNKHKNHTVQDLLSIVRYPSPEVLELAKAAEIFEQTLEIIHSHVKAGHTYNLQGHDLTYRDLVSPTHLALIANMSGCFQPSHVVDCSDMCLHKKYRTLDGTCNNLQNPTWGASNQAFRRLLDPVYENGFNTPVGWDPAKLYHGFNLPSPRLISTLVIGTNQVSTDDSNTHMLMQWGQFLDHDINLTPQSISFSQFSDGRKCNETCENHYPCFPIQVPRSDPRIHNQACLGFSRSSAICSSGRTSIFFNTVAPRQQLNVITAYIDASNVYGSTVAAAQQLRDLNSNRGLLHAGPSPDGKALLPFDNIGVLAHVDCQREPSKYHLPCFLAGDHRANEQLALTSMHTLWLREHNRIATELLQMNPHWDGDMLYYETRKIIGAIMQHITYTVWLPYMIGPKGMSMLGSYNGYIPSVDATILNEFATAAFRVGHSLIRPIIFRLNETFQPIKKGNLELHKAFFSPYRLVEEGGIDPLIRGLFGVAAKKKLAHELMNSELTEQLFALANAVGQDLASLNIQRGRDHGLPSYNRYRKLCNLTSANTFDDLRYEITQRRVREKLQALYGHPDNIDLFVGGLIELPLPGSKVGPTFQCIFVDQFRKLRDGDRFWYENPGVFSVEQLIQIKQTSLARVICDSSDNIERVQKDVFLLVESTRDYLSCDEIPKLDLKMWADCCHDCDKSGNFQSITSHYQSRRAAHSYLEDREYQHRQYIPAPPRFHGHQLTDMEGDDSSNVTSNHISEQMDQFDTRINGMESMVNRLNNMVRSLRRKLKHLQKKMVSSNLSCKDDKENVYSHGENWVVHACRKCQCKNGHTECVNELCPLIDCKTVHRLPGVCCPVCRDPPHP